VKFKLNWPRILIWLTFVAVFIFLIYPYSDLDWGWHFHYGEYFIKTGQILRDNLYTWTVPDYKWANSSWFYDIFLYLSYIKLGFAGLSIIGAILAFLIFFIPTFTSKLNYLFLGGMALFFIKISAEGLDEGIRGQTFGLLLLCLLTFILTKAITKPKILFLIPPLILVWANFNGTFSLGILILGIFTASNIVIRIINRLRHKPNVELINLKNLILVSFLSVCASFVNPFTYRVYFEGLSHIVNPWVSYISEWEPPSFSCQDCNVPYFLIFQVLLIIIFATRRKLSDFPYIFTLLLLTVESYSQRRYLSMLVTASLPIVAMATSGIKFNWDKHLLTKILYTALLTTLILTGLFIRLPKYHLTNYSFEDYCHFSSRCSPGLADFLIKNPPMGRGFNFYDWGGFLIGRGVNAKLFVDGRMHLWNDNGYMPFADYIEIYSNQDLELFRQYNFDWVIVRNDSYLAQRLLTSNIFSGAWKRVYYDQTASYFIRAKI
jgi:hypothetical protein